MFCSRWSGDVFILKWERTLKLLTFRNLAPCSRQNNASCNILCSGHYFICAHIKKALFSSYSLCGDNSKVHISRTQESLVWISKHFWLIGRLPCHASEVRKLKIDLTTFTITWEKEVLIALDCKSSFTVDICLLWGGKLIKALNKSPVNFPRAKDSKLRKCPMNILPCLLSLSLVSGFKEQWFIASKQNQTSNWH